MNKLFKKNHQLNFQILKNLTFKIQFKILAQLHIIKKQLV